MFNNISRGIGADGKTSEYPGSFVLKTFTITNNKGQTVDMQKFIKSFTISEELYSPVLVCSVEIMDNLNIFHDYGFCGQEVINLSVFKRDKGTKSDKYATLRFVVKEYPSFSRDTTQLDVQYYTIVAVSDIGYFSSLTKISRSVTGHTSDNIKNIFLSDLSVSSKNFVITGNPTTNFSGVLPINTPINNAQWLTKKTFDNEGSPFLLFQTLNGVIQLSSLKSLISDSTNPVYQKYTYHGEFNEKPGSTEAYKELNTRILRLESNLKLDRISQAKSGAFASETHYIDVANKNITSRAFNHSNEIDKSLSLGSGKSYSSDFGVQQNGSVISLNDMSNARINYVYVNPSSYGGGSANSHTSLQEAQHRANSIMANLENHSHTIVVYGDMNLSAGRKISIDLPKTISAHNAKKFGVKMKQSQRADETLSGKYLIFRAAHRFEEGTYVTQLMIGRDSA